MPLTQWKVAALGAVFFGCYSAAGAPSVSHAAGQRLNQYVAAYATNGDFSGNVLVTSRGKVLFEKSYGSASLRFALPNQPDRRFAVASVTKTFTAAAIALLEKDGRLKLEDTVEKYLPELPQAGEIKIWHLLAHQSGLQNPDYDQIAARNVSADELLRMIGVKPLAFPPGSQTRYSNAGYIALARIVEKVSGLSFADFLRQRVFEPLGMRASGTWRSGMIVPLLAEGYAPGIGTALRASSLRDPSSLFGSGSVYSTARDLDRWVTAIDQKRLFDISKQPYPFGWGRRKWFDRDVLVQSGVISGYSAVILTVPKEQLHIVVVMNTQSGFTGDEGKTLLGILYGEAAEPPARRGAAPAITPANLAAFAGTYSWGTAKIPMHIESSDDGLALRWDTSTSAVLLTPMSDSEFLDRSSFGQVQFSKDGATWVQNGERTACPKIR